LLKLWLAYRVSDEEATRSREATAYKSADL
jgi:hypothetical protein